MYTKKSEFYYIKKIKNKKDRFKQITMNLEMQ